MFIDELKPIFTKLAEQPVAFVSGFLSGVLRLKISEDPLKNWLEKQGVDTDNNNPPNNGNSPQSISID